MNIALRSIAIGCLLVLLSATSVSATIELRSDTPEATAGYYRLDWDAGDGPLRLVESRQPAFDERTVVYRGHDTASLLSGKPDGTYYYRLESAPGEPLVVSNTVQVTVRHHSLGRAFTFFAIGFSVFAATLGLIIVGSRRARG